MKLKDPESAYQRLVPDAVCYQYDIGVLVSKLRQAATHKQRKTVERLIHALKEACKGSLDTLEYAQIQLECGRAAYAIEKKELAFQSIELGIAILTPIVNCSNEHRHFHGVALWMQGLLLHEQKNLSLKALEYFKSSLAEFEILALPYQAIWPTTEWYHAAIQEMRQQLNQYWEVNPDGVSVESVSPERTERPASPGPVPKPTAGDAPSSNTQILRLPVAGDNPPDSAPPARPQASHLAAATRKPGSRVGWVEARLAVARPRLLNIIGRIPAGGFGVDGQLPHRLGSIRVEGEVKAFNIQGVQCRLYSLRTALGIIRLSSAKNYFILKVVGDSMDRAGISPGDFVLMAQQDTAEQGDIVAAEINSEDEGATLKSFARRGRRICLVPNSSNLKYQEQYFDPGASGFSIRGVVIGVFKPS